MRGSKYNVQGRPTRKRKKPRRARSVTEVVDDGVIDKRLLVIEPEFAAALSERAEARVTRCPQTIREAWDSGTLRTLTKHDPVVATEAHISIIAHITAGELRAELGAD